VSVSLAAESCDLFLKKWWLIRQLGLEVINGELFAFAAEMKPPTLPNDPTGSVTLGRRIPPLGAVIGRPEDMPLGE
jgi:hypothetical protein